MRLLRAGHLLQAAPAVLPGRKCQGAAALQRRETQQVDAPLPPHVEPLELE
jgi:hypothetical protein